MSRKASARPHSTIGVSRRRCRALPHIATRREEESNYTIASRLEGKLFLAHGDVDENVPMPATIKLVDALVKANKDFDFLIMPNRPHGFGNDPYFVRRRWDYFVKHLLSVDPPSGFNISQPRPTSTSQGDGVK